MTEQESPIMTTNTSTVTLDEFRTAMHNPVIRNAALAYAASTYDDPAFQDAYNLNRCVDLVAGLDRHNRAKLRQQCSDPSNPTHAIIRSLIDTCNGEF
jgi:hypothetical protein